MYKTTPVTMTMGAPNAFDTSVPFYQTTWRHISEDTALRLFEAQPT